MPSRKKKKPKLLTVAGIHRMCAFLESGCTKAEAAIKAGFSKTSFYEWMEEGRKEDGDDLCKLLVTEIEDAELRCEGDRSMRLMEAGEKDWRADYQMKVMLPAIRHKHEMNRLEKQIKEEQLNAIKLENEKRREEIERVKEETAYRKLTNEALRIQKEGPERTQYQEEVGQLQIANSQITEEDYAAYYGVPSPQEDEEDEIHPDGDK